MTLVRFNNSPYRFSNLFQELGNRFDTYQNKSGTKIPAVNITEDEKGYHLELPAPGRSKEDFSISVDQDLLKIQYEAKHPEVTPDKKIIRNEFSLESFTRTFSLDQHIESDAIEASYINGILNLFLPKKKATEPEQKKIQIQ